MPYPEESMRLRALDRAVLVLVLMPYVWLMNRFWFVTDDSFISFRYAYNWAQGHGPRYNLGDHVPVEGYSNFLWVAISAGIETLGGDLTRWPLLLSSFTGAVLVVLVFRVLRTRLEVPLPHACLAALTLSLAPPFAAWATGGLATMPFSLLLFLTFERLVLREQGIGVKSAGAAGLALSLLRVEGLYWALILAVLCAYSRRRQKQPVLRPLAGYLGIVLLGFSIYYLWRYSYYESLFANTVYVKAAMSSESLGRGFNYLTLQALSHLPWLLAIPAAAVAFKASRRSWALPLAVMPFGVFAYAVLTGGDFMAMGRFLIPAAAFIAVGLGVVLRDLTAGRGPTSARGAVAFVATAAILVLGMLPGWNLHPVPEATRKSFDFRLNKNSYYDEYVMWERMKDNTATWSELGRALAAYADPSDSVVLGAIGAKGYYSQLFVYDRYGLVSPSVARQEEQGRLRSPGHDKKVKAEFFLDQEPTYLEVNLLPRKSVREFADKQRNKAYADRYVVDFMELEEDPDQVLVVVRRLPDGAKAKESWRKLRKRLKAGAR